EDTAKIMMESLKKNELKMLIDHYIETNKNNPLFDKALAEKAGKMLQYGGAGLAIIIVLMLMQSGAGGGR
ncbi:MAG: hypothetical protein Q8P72_03450, partial [Candidatus Roizmanbacteria bacterium]|nr:hypothetical protein [Candidatus Roizmanbacteria bacterium]